MPFTRRASSSLVLRPCRCWSCPVVCGGPLPPVECGCAWVVSPRRRRREETERLHRLLPASTCLVSVVCRGLLPPVECGCAEKDFAPRTSRRDGVAPRFGLGPAPVGRVLLCGGGFATAGACFPPFLAAVWLRRRVLAQGTSENGTCHVSAVPVCCFGLWEDL